MMLFLSTLHIELLVLHLLLLSGVHSHGLDEEDGDTMADEAERNKRGRTGQDITKLEIFLGKSWQELDRMLFCTKMPTCVMRYNKIFRIGKQNVRANLIQSLTFTLHQIKDITKKIKKIKR